MLELSGTVATTRHMSMCRRRSMLYASYVPPYMVQSLEHILRGTLTDLCMYLDTAFSTCIGHQHCLHKALGQVWAPPKT